MKMISNFSRRNFIETSAALTFAALGLKAKGHAAFKIGVTDWNLKETGKLEAVALAKSLGFAGVQVSLGRDPINGNLPMDNAQLEEQYLRAAKTQGIALAGTCLDILHVNCLMNDKLGQKWVADGIPITKKLNAKVMLLPFFGKCALKTAQERDYVGDVLKEIAPEAERQSVLLGLEDTISAEDNVRIMERTKSPAVLVYYDVGNSTNNGFDVAKEIRWLGKKRICQIHLKDKGYIGQGAINFEEVMKAILDIGYDGFCNLETSAPSGSVDADMRRNLAAVREFTRKAENA
jgi:L-ribulose-5-phosphate 3-epimerase